MVVITATFLRCYPEFQITTSFHQQFMVADSVLCLDLIFFPFFFHQLLCHLIVDQFCCVSCFPLSIIWCPYPLHVFHILKYQKMSQVCGFKIDWLCSFAQLFQWKNWQQLSLSLSLQDWGRAGDVAALGVCWHVPSMEEENFVFQLLSRLLHPELERIKDHVSGDQPMSRCAVLFLSFLFLDVIRRRHDTKKTTVFHY